MSAHRDTGAERPPRRRMVPSVGLQLLSPPCTPSVSPSGQGRRRRWLRERPSNLVGLGAGGGSGPLRSPTYSETFRVQLLLVLRVHSSALSLSRFLPAGLSPQISFSEASAALLLTAKDVAIFPLCGALWQDLVFLSAMQHPLKTSGALRRPVGNQGRS